jgi:hypothetical protein
MDGGIHATHNLAEKGKKGSVGENQDRGIHDGDRRRKDGRNSGEIGRESRTMEKERKTFVLDFRGAGNRRLNLQASWSSSGVASGKSIWIH